MHRRLSRWSGLLLGGLAAAGVLIAHGVAYLLTFPNAWERARELESTGHGSELVLAVALGALVAGLARFVSSITVGGEAPPARGLFGHTVIRLVPLQVVGFAVLEAAERWWVGAGIGDMAMEPAIALGLLLQVVAAVAGAGALVVLAAALERLVRMRRVLESAREPAALEPSFRSWVPALPVASGGATLRGPPL